MTTAVAIVIAVAVIVMLYLLSTLNESSPQGTVATTGDGREAAGEAPGEEYGQNAGSGDSSAAIDLTGLVDLGEGQKLERSFDLDIDGDGSGETLVLVRGAGEYEPLDWYLLDTSSAGPAVVFERKGISQGELAVDGPRIVETEGLYNAEDAPCCPSSLKRTIFVWKEGALVGTSVLAQPVGAPIP